MFNALARSKFTDWLESTSSFVLVISLNSLPASTLSEATVVNTSPPSLPRSIKKIGVLAEFAALIEVTTALESTGLIKIASTF